MIAIHSEKVILDDKICSSWVGMENGTIVYVGTSKPYAEEYYEYGDNYISPGFIDILTHGAGGYDFLKEDKIGIIDGCKYHLAHGTTSILPTISAAPLADMKEAVKSISLAQNEPNNGPNIIGAHMEGPYLSKAQCGAQCTDYITKPNKKDYESIINEFGSSIARWTYAPEEDINGEFCKFLSNNNIIPSSGHTNAKEDDMKVAIENGCVLVTHLYSCTSTITRNNGFRSIGVIESAFLHDELYVEIIGDGKHLPSNLIKMIVKIKGTNRTILITDSLHIACTNIKEGNMSGTPFIVEDDVCKLKDRTAFAGSVATMDKVLRFITKQCNFSIIDAITMACKTPAKMLNLKKGIIQEGYDADIVVFDDNIDVSNVFVIGKKYDNLPKERIF